MGTALFNFVASAYEDMLVIDGTKGSYVCVCVRTCVRLSVNIMSAHSFHTHTHIYTRTRTHTHTHTHTRKRSSVSLSVWYGAAHTESAKHIASRSVVCEEVSIICTAVSLSPSHTNTL